MAAFVSRFDIEEKRWCVALSGGPDSLALTAVAAGVRPTTALIVDHRLQPDSASVAETARQAAVDLGCADARVLRVVVGRRGGPEAAARAARYQALKEASGEKGRSFSPPAAPLTTRIEANLSNRPLGRY